MIEIIIGKLYQSEINHKGNTFFFYTWKFSTYDDVVDGINKDTFCTSRNRMGEKTILLNVLEQSEFWWDN